MASRFPLLEVVALNFHTGSESTMHSWKPAAGFHVCWGQAAQFAEFHNQTSGKKRKASVFWTFPFHPTGKAEVAVVLSTRELEAVNRCFFVGTATPAPEARACRACTGLALTMRNSSTSKAHSALPHMNLRFHASNSLRVNLPWATP